MLDLLDCNGKKDIKSMTLEEVTAQMAALGEKSFSAKQLYDWMHVKLTEKFDDMSSVARELRQSKFVNRFFGFYGFFRKGKTPPFDRVFLFSYLYFFQFL